MNLLGLVSSFFRSGTPVVENLFTVVLEQTRKPVFYRELAVPDCYDGRFDFLCLNAHLAARRLQTVPGAEGKKLARTFIERLCIEFERASRNIGVSDVSVGKHVRRMSQGYYGRAEAYEAAIQEADNELLAKAFKRNLYAKSEIEVSEFVLTKMCAYIVEATKHLDQQSDQDLITGQIDFPQPAEDVSSL